MYYTDKIVDFIKNIKYKEIPEEVIKHVKLCILDILGVSLAGSVTNASKIAVNFALDYFGSGGNSTIINNSLKSTCIGAAWANSVMASTLDMDDGHNYAMGHPGAVIIPGTLALAESNKIGGEKVIEAILAGYEVSIRIAGSRVPFYIHTYATGPWGVYGAAIAAAKLLELDKEGIIHAIGIAGSHGPTRPHSKEYEFVPMVKECIGWAGMTGISSAILAEKGFTAFRNFLDYEEFFDREALVAGLGEWYQFIETWFKPYSSCRWAHSSIDCVLDLVQKYQIKEEEIERINIFTFERASLMGSKKPKTLETAQYSIPFCVGVAVCYGMAGPEEVSEKNLNDPRVLEVAGKVNILLDPGMESLFGDKLPAAVEIQTKRGLFKTRVDSPKGDLVNPMRKDDIQMKFSQLTSTILGAKKIKEVMRSVDNFEKLAEISSLMAVFKPEKNVN